jgi:hypothetical protein
MNFQPSRQYRLEVIYDSNRRGRLDVNYHNSNKCRVPQADVEPKVEPDNYHDYQQLHYLQQRWLDSHFDTSSGANTSRSSSPELVKK